MPDSFRCSLNVAFHFPGATLAEALDGAVRAGFHTVELLDPYSIDLDDLEHELGRRDLHLDLFNLPMGDFAAGDRGIAGDPERVDEFRRGVERAAAIAERLGVTKVNALAGRRIETLDREAQLHHLVEQLQWAASVLDGVGVRVNTELLNPVESPGLLVADLDSTLRLLERLDGRVGLQLDIYHLQRTHGELLPTIAETAPVTGHIQIADAPRRTEPGSGEINFPNIFAAIAASGYDGLVGCEFRPSATDVDSFAWMDACGAIKT
ncbi:MAG: TIM barrel protein [Candidatus Limnocylindrales bacterium]